MPKADGRSQLAFTFEAPTPASTPAALAGADRRMAIAVAEALNGDDRPRAILAAEMSLLLDEDVSKAMLDAYASPARDAHNVPAHRLLALIAVTSRFDLLDRQLRAIGAAVLVGEELQAARVGHLRVMLERTKQELKDAEARAIPIEREGGSS